MNNIAKNNAVHPQTVEIPQPLEIHPSVSADLAREMLRVADTLCRCPELFDGGTVVDLYPDRPRCIIGHLTGNRHLAFERWPENQPALYRMYGEANAHGDDAGWAIARIEHFLRTGE